MELLSSIKKCIRFSKNKIHFLQALVANIVYGFPSKNMVVVGVTGTDGKTTTSSLLYHVLNAAGYKAALISTIGAFIDGEKYDVGFHVTTPSPFLLQKYIKKALDKGARYLVLEITSHALDQNRATGIHFDATILTNITHEHLDYHGTYKRYVKAKLQLLKTSPFNVVNYDDASYEYVKKDTPGNTLFTFSLNNSNADISLRNFSIKTNLFGDFNILNALSVVAIARKLQIPDDIIQKALISFKAPEGRQEILREKDFYVILDFAHTPYSFEKMLSESKKLVKGGGRLIHIFGCAGKRDFSKRPLMGKASSQNADVIILTSEDPRSEDVATINSQIKKGIDKKFLYKSPDNYTGERNLVFEIEDRKKALEFAVKIARKGDVVIATGKGHEKSMNMGKGEIPWNERKILENAL